MKHYGSFEGLKQNQTQSHQYCRCPFVPVMRKLNRYFDLEYPEWRIQASLHLVKKTKSDLFSACGATEDMLLPKGHFTFHRPSVVEWLSSSTALSCIGPDLPRGDVSRDVDF